MGKFNIFFSYNWSSKKQVELLYQNLKDKLGIKIWLDKNEINGSMMYDRISEGIRESDAFLCCITNAYCESMNCRLEIEYAFKLKKYFIVLMLEKLEIDKIGGVGMIINPLSRINCYNYGDEWPNECLDKIINAFKVYI